MTATNAAARGGAITLLGQGFRVGIQLIALVVLGRLLPPEAFGLVVMVTAVVGIGELIRDFGLSAAAMQATQLSQAEKSNLFWANSGLGVVLTGVACLIAVPLAGFYDEDLLVPITLALSSTFVLNGIQTQFQVELARNSRFGVLAASDAVAQVLGLAAAVIIALMGGSYWALVAQLLVISVVLCVTRVIASRWAPSWPNRHVTIRHFLKYGWHLALAQMLNYLSANLPSVLIGLKSGPAAVGSYNRAYQIAIMPISQVLAPLTNVLLPALSRVKSEKERFNLALLGIQRVLGYATGLIFAIVIAGSVSVVEIALGDGWEETAPLLSVLAAGAVFQSLSFVGYWVFLSQAATKSLVHYNLVTKGLVAALSVAGMPFGAEGIAAGYAIGLMLSWPICLWWLHRLGLIAAPAQLFSGIRIVLIAGIGCAAGFAVNASLALPSILQLLCIAFAVLGAGLLAMVIAPPTRRDLRDIVVVVRGLAKRA